jgi:hypothetical protein
VRKETETVGVVETPNSTAVRETVTPMSASVAVTEVVSDLSVVIGDLERNRRITESMSRR